ncbi:putative L-ascorbate peroxidase 6-like [Tripterygium wilfordii]|uniref:L-ascorbate peroxidase n=1 Tax=Tripterygium wilfordii TaxID=458696 RepID=A0A7J7DP78_TRIWF|nr:putative L-ascorbate peroxidase 6 [Tripterygium wilfordii]KAF5748182.1 putative L-ascorbate peroxidase 6-like [Tripterygium wilfordii]
MAHELSCVNRPLEMMSSSSTSPNPALLGSFAPLFCSLDSKISFKFPALSRWSSLSPVRIRAAPLRDCSHHFINDESGQSRSNRRRMLLFTSTLPFLSHFHVSMEAIGVEATESDSSNLLLVKKEIKKILSKGKAASLLRLVFHDAGTFEMDGKSGGMNGSIIYELDRPENAGLRKPLKILEKARSEMDSVLSVSWADMIAVAGAEAVSFCGGPPIPVQLGRLDSMEPDAEGKLPQESLDASGLKQCFQRKGFSTQELVALSGAHTLGSKGFGNPTVFDNSYYKILLEKPWITSATAMSSMIGLPSDRALVEDEDCLRWIKKYADNEDLFFEDFKNSYSKLVNSGARWKSL